MSTISAESSNENIKRHLILGGARSGKSAFAEQQLIAWQASCHRPVIYVATSSHRNDSEMLQRVAHHQARRPEHWQTQEHPIELAKALHQIEIQQTGAAVLLDCLTLWMLNIIEADCRIEQTEQFLAFLDTTCLPIVMVSNEVGLGVVPMGKLSREFVDELGRLHQEVAKRVARVTFVTAGLPMDLKKDV